MEDTINIYDIDWQKLQERRQELKNISDMEGLSPEEADELIEINTAFSVLRADLDSKKETTAYEYHPGHLFFAMCEQTNSNINACLEAGQPMSNQAPPIISDPHWENKIEAALRK
jgi:hypothetical protein